MIKKYHIFCEIINKRTKASAKYGKTFLDNAHKALPIIKMKNAKNETENEKKIQSLYNFNFIF